MAIKKLIGTDKNQVPLNRDLGTLAYQDSNAVNITGGVIDVNAGSATVASVGAAGDENTGLFFPAADTVAVTTGGTERVRVNSSGNIGLGTASPTQRLDVNGVVTNTSGAVFSRRSTTAHAPNLGIILGTADKNATPAGGEGTINIYSNDTTNQLQATIDLVTSSTAANRRLRFNCIEQSVAYRNITFLENGGNLGVGTASPSRLLDVGGNFRVAVSANSADVTSKSDNTGALNLYGGSAFNAGAGIVINGSASTSPNVITFTRGTFTESMRIDASGNVGVGTTGPTAMLDINSNTVRVRTARTPASATAAGNAGDICWDANYVYVCVATNTWKRSALSTW